MQGWTRIQKIRTDMEIKDKDLKVSLSGVELQNPVVPAS